MKDSNLQSLELGETRPKDVQMWLPIIRCEGGSKQRYEIYQRNKFGPENYQGPDWYWKLKLVSTFFFLFNEGYSIYKFRSSGCSCQSSEGTTHFTTDIFSTRTPRHRENGDHNRDYRQVTPGNYPLQKKYWNGHPLGKRGNLFYGLYLPRFCILGGFYFFKFC